MLLPSNQTLLLLVLVLLLLWLLLRVQEPEAQRVARTPLSPSELARMTFDAARAGDARAWRELFLRGEAAGAVLGEAAQPWRAACTVARLTTDLQVLQRVLGAGVTFAGGRADNTDRCFLIVRTATGATEEHPIGRFVKVGSALRLVEPPSGPLEISAE